LRRYGNYRHQSDVCHAYQIMIANGMDPAKVIVMAVDDIASDPSNPFPGKVFNKPSDAGDPGVDVYDGCVIDYSGAQVTPEIFTKVLSGDAAGLNGGKVLASTKSDRVFVNFVDHGGVNLIGFPRSTVSGWTRSPAVSRWGRGLLRCATDRGRSAAERAQPRGRTACSPPWPRVAPRRRCTRPS
jgi:hypothetical protein